MVKCVKNFKIETHSATFWHKRGKNDEMIQLESWLIKSVENFYLKAQTIENELKNWVDRMGYCKASRGSHLSDVVVHS